MGGVFVPVSFWRENEAFTEIYAMNTDTTFEMSTLRFDGERFEGHALDVECTQELIAYRNLVLECAKSLWRVKYPNRSNLPRGFEKGFRLQFNRLGDGSAVVPLQRVRTRARPSARNCCTSATCIRCYACPLACFTPKA